MRDLHQVQVAVLNTLRHTQTARFSTLMQVTTLTSDTFKFHVQKLTKLGYIEKSAAGQYCLTVRGKEFANNLDEAKLATQRQPKLSVLVLASKNDTQDEPLFLVQKRLRSPYFGFWSCIGGPIQWGQDAEDVAAAELKKQTGLTATCAVRAFYRQRDYEAGSNELLEDKLFIVLEATEVSGELSNDWYGGKNAWMSEHDFAQQPKHFASVCEAIKILRTSQTYVSHETHYDLNDY